MIERIELRDGEIVEIDFDIETNLPKLPVDYFWRIKSRDFGGIDVELRKKNRWGSTRIDLAITNNPNIMWVRVSAGRLWYAFHQRNKHRLDLQEFAKYYGDYPPKKAL